MNRRKCFVVFIATATVISLVVIAHAVDFSGVWKGQADFPDGQSRELTYTLKVENGKLTGTIESPRGKVDIADGKVDGEKFTFNTVREGNSIAHEGKWVDGKIKITVHGAGGDREYTISPADTSAVASTSGAATLAPDLNGEWKGKIKDENGGDVDLTYHLKVDGNKLTGTVEGPAGKLNLENGQIEKGLLKFQISFGDFHIQHEGKLTDGNIKITSHMPDKEREYIISRVFDIAGPWETKFTTPEGNDVVLKYDLKVDGEKLTGTVEGPRGKLDLKEGKASGAAVSYKVVIANNDVSYEGKFVDGKIKVKSHGGPFGDREYTLTRPVTDISGAWEATFKDETGNDLPLKFNLKIDGEKLTGDVKSPQGDGTIINGVVKGDDVSFDVEFGNDTIKHKGKLTATEIKLTVNGFGTQWDLTLKRPAAK